MSWLSGCRRLHRRYERKPEHFLAFVGIAATLKQWHILRKARCSPSRMTAVVQAILTLEYQGR